MTATSTRLRAIDWLRGLVMILMTVDHAGVFDAAHMHGDSARNWVHGSALPAGEFLTRWITHLCAPTFVLLAGVSMALSMEKRRDQPGQTGFLVKRGLLIAALDPLWMALAFSLYARIPLQVLYAIGISMVCMAALRRLPTRIMFVAALSIVLLGELTSYRLPDAQPLRALVQLMFLGGPVTDRIMCPYPFVPWLSIMMFGWVLGRWLLEPRTRFERARTLALIGVGLLLVFGVVRGVDGYGNWGLHREAAGLLQWLHVSKYPPSIAFMALELGIAFLLFAGFMAIDDPERARRPLGFLALLGSTAFFYYLLHFHLMALAAQLLDWDASRYGLAKTWGVAGTTVLVLLGPCWLYRRYKAAHPNGWTRYL